MSDKGFSVQMAELLDDYSREVQRAANNSIDKVTKEAVSKLKSTSPKRKGNYAKGWTRKRLKDRSGINNVVVHNRVYQLTHLLENGHVIRNSKGTYGRAPGIKHIKPVEEWANSELPAEIEREL